MYLIFELAYIYMHPMNYEFLQTYFLDSRCTIHCMSSVQITTTLYVN